MHLSKKRILKIKTMKMELVSIHIKEVGVECSIPVPRKYTILPEVSSHDMGVVAINVFIALRSTVMATAAAASSSSSSSTPKMRLRDVYYR